MGQNMTGKKVTICAGAAALAILGAGAWFLRAEIAGWRRSLVVRGLLDPQKRDAVWRRVVGWQIYAVPVTHPQYQIEFDPDAVVTEVILCPQARGWPILAVF